MKRCTAGMAGNGESQYKRHQQQMMTMRSSEGYRGNGGQGQLQQDDHDEYTLLAIDCEMCDTAAGHELTRVSVTDVNHKTLLDMLVKPLSGPVLNYLTQWSGVTEELLRDVTATIEDAQNAVLRLMQAAATGQTVLDEDEDEDKDDGGSSALGDGCKSDDDDRWHAVAEVLRRAEKPQRRHVVLVGHSLENDLRALKICHCYVIDTSVCFPASTPGRKHGLRSLAERNLNLLIQTAGDDGHDSTEDASTAMRLVLLRLRFGWDDVAIHNYKVSRVRQAAVQQEAAVAKSSARQRAAAAEAEAHAEEKRACAERATVTRPLAMNASVRVQMEAGLGHMNQKVISQLEQQEEEESSTARGRPVAPPRRKRAKIYAADLF